MVFHSSLSDSKSPQVSRTLLSILAVLNNTVVCMVSTRPPTSKSSSPSNNPLVTVPKAPITIGINCHLHIPLFFQFPCKVEVLILLFRFFQFYSVVNWESKVDNFANSLFFFWGGGVLSISVIVCFYVSLGISAFYYLFTSTLKKNLCAEHKHY